jgi:hypothetical protein
LLQGRDFEEADIAASPPVVAVNQAFVNRFVPTGSPVGLRLRLNQPMLGTNEFGPSLYATIAGVVGDVTLEETGAPPQPIVYAPLAQNLWSPATWLAVKTANNSRGVPAAIRETVAGIVPDEPLDEMTSMDAVLATQFAEPRFQSALMSAFAGLAFVLAVVGVYSMNAYVVSQQRREIGVRLAVGAMPATVVGELVRRSMVLSLTGVVLGLLGALAAATVLRSLLVGVDPSDPLPLLGAAGVLVAAAAAASYIPARRAARIDPSLMLREE